MLKSAPKERELVSWIFVVTWSLIIFVTIPFARALQRHVAQLWGRGAFIYVVVAAIIIALVVSVIQVHKRQNTALANYLWLFSVAAVFFGYTIKLSEAPEETTHFIQYGLLGIFVFRALTHRLNDLSIYFSASLICGIIGIIDETIQWITPHRVWSLRDIWINFFASALILVGIAKGLNPQIIQKSISQANARLVCRICIVAVVLLCLSLINTPARIVWYSERFPFLTFLKKNNSVMVEYGYLYNDSDIGIFRSRLSPIELKQKDREQSKAAAAILDRFQDTATYQEFLKRYSPLTDSFLHEARVHLFGRDIHYSMTTKCENKQDKCARSFTIAFRENQILEKYFSKTLHQSTYAWSSEKSDWARNRRYLLQDAIYDSKVSSSLITHLSEDQIACSSLLLVIALALLHWYLRKDKPKMLE